MKMARQWFNNLNLEGKITLALVTGSLTIATLIASASFLYFRHLLIDHMTVALIAEARLEKREIELLVAGTLSQVQSLAANTVTANALADSNGRETYLVPLFADLKFPVQGASVVLTDYRGKPVVRNGENAFGGLSPPDVVSALGNQPKPKAFMSFSPQRKPILTVAMPVIYRLTGNVEGMVVVGLPLDALINRDEHTNPGSPDEMTLRRLESGKTFTAGPLPESSALSTQVPIELPKDITPVPLELIVSSPQSELKRGLRAMIGIYLLFGALIVGVIIVIARKAALALSAPLHHLSLVTEEIASSGRPNANLLPTGNDEFGRLALAFNRMVDRLAESYAVLESRVEERTRALRSSEARLRYVMDATGEGIWDWNINAGTVIHNTTWCEILGLDLKFIEHPITRFTDILHPEDRDETMERIQTSLKTGTPYRHEHRMLRSDGSVIWVLDRGAVVESDESGDAVRMVGSISDITESRSAQARLQDRTEQLHAIFALSPDGFVSFDNRHHVKYVSQAFQRMSGFTENDLVGMSEEALVERINTLCSANSGLPSITSMLSATQGGDIHHRELIELTHPSKRVLEVGIRTSLAETVSQILYFRDVTHETEVDRMKSEFLSTAAHELRTPMASVYGFSELLLAQEFDQATQRELLGTIFRQSELMASIINELLDLARIEARRGKDFIIERIDINALLKQVIEGYKVPEGRISPSLSLNDDDSFVRGDRNKLLQSMTNILSNAYKYSPSGGTVVISIARAPDRYPNLVGLSVVDQGIGMSPEQVARVGERFYRADTSGKIPGTGLGMAIVKEIAELHRGQFEISSQLGEGSKVTLWIPAAD